MRERLVAAFVGLTVVVVALFGIPRAYLLADLVRSQEQHRVDRTADVVAVAVADHGAAGAPVDTKYLNELTGPSERIVVRPAVGATVRSTDGPPPDSGDVMSTQPLPGGGAVTVARGGNAVDKEVSGALLPLVLLGLGLVLLAAIVGYLLARRLARPFTELAEAARGFGVGQLQPDLRDYGVPEARAIAEALRASGQSLDASMRHERDLAVHASHELRTPVAALRLELEDLALWPETPPTVATEIGRATGELDRLSSAIDTLLGEAHQQHTATAIDLDLDALVADTVGRLGDTRVSYQPAGTLPTRLDPLPVVQLVGDLVAAAGADGAEVRLSASDQGTHLELRVAAPGLAAAPGTEIENLAASVGGHVARDDAGWIIRLPKHELAGSR